MKCLLFVCLALVSCKGSRAKPSSDDEAANILRAEKQAAQQSVERVCERPITVYDGSLTVNASDYQHPVARGEDFVDEPIADLDRVLSKATRVRFTLDYPFERELAGEVTGPITLRRTLDAIRAGFRQMYGGTTEREIPGMMNKDVTGPYGRAFHGIDDLVIEQIELCADDTLSIGIGS